VLMSSLALPSSLCHKKRLKKKEERRKCPSECSLKEYGKEVETLFKVLQDFSKLLPVLWVNGFVGITHFLGKIVGFACKLVELLFSLFGRTEAR